MNPNVNPYMNAQMQALMDSRSTEPTPAAGFGGRVMPGMAQPVQPVAQQTSGAQALMDYYRGNSASQPGIDPGLRTTQADAVRASLAGQGGPQGQPQMGGPGTPINASNNAGPWNPRWNVQPAPNPIGQPREMESSFVTTPNTPSTNYSPPMSPQMSPQMQALYNRQRMQ